MKARLPPELLANTLLVVRSANDSREECATFCARSHGVMPKCAFSKEGILQTFATLWYERFGSPGDAEDEETGERSADGRMLPSLVGELLQSARKLAAHLDPSAPWDVACRQLHLLKGELQSLPDTLGGRVGALVGAIDRVRRHAARPRDFAHVWEAIRAELTRLLEAAEADAGCEGGGHGDPNGAPSRPRTTSRDEMRRRQSAYQMRAIDEQRAS